MCGITGIAFAKNTKTLATIRNMTDTLEHRGPDDQGIWIDQERGTALGHQRLAILDLSQEGHQPMVSANGQYVIALNGEIYNFQELKKALGTSLQLRGHSDTEVLLEAISHWGLTTTLKRCVGMFAFALWDKAIKKLYLARDRFGEKPLYYGHINGTLIFASELKALKKFGAWQGEIDPNALADYLRYRYVPGSQSIYKNIYKVTPGTYLTFDAEKMHETVYWSATETAQQGFEHPLQVSFLEATDMLEQKLSQSVHLQMTADVPVGAFLSGGIDSSIIVALMQAQSTQRIKTFSIGFTEKNYNEAHFAQAIAKHLGTDHTELYLSSQDAIDTIPLLATIYDEPFGDSSAIPTYLLSKLTQQHVTVSLSGDGGDELFGGYKRYWLAQNLWHIRNKLPQTLKNSMISLLNFYANYLPFNKFTTRAQRLSGLLAADRSILLNRMLTSTTDTPTVFLHQGTEYSLTNFEHLFSQNFIAQMMHQDTLAYLPNDILVKVDRAAMAVGLESRVPFLDHRIFEFAWQLPINYKINKGAGKLILKALLKRYIPEELFERPKMGFGIPLSTWLKGPLRTWAEELLSTENLHRQNYFNEQKVRQLWQEYLNNHNQHADLLWNILMFCAWLKVYQTTF
jgi:asparagine synthase (glutamine-hydrolysing)